MWPIASYLTLEFKNTCLVLLLEAPWWYLAGNVCQVLENKFWKSRYNELGIKPINSQGERMNISKYPFIWIKFCLEADHTVAARFY